MLGRCRLVVATANNDLVSSRSLALSAPFPIVSSVAFILILFFALFFAGLAQGQAVSIAARLGQYQAGLHVQSVAGVAAKSFSGVAYMTETQSLYVIDNDNANIYILSITGVLRGTISTSGFLDPEGIVYQGGNAFLIAEEGLANIVRIALPLSGVGPVAHSAGKVLNIGPNMANSGIEGVGYCVATHTAYAVKETAPSRLYRIELDSAGNPKTSYPDDPFSITGKSGDAADIWALEDGHFIIVNQEDNRAEGYDAQGHLLSTLPLGMQKPEGLAVDTVDGTLYVVGEPNEFKVFKPMVTSIQRVPTRSNSHLRVSGSLEANILCRAPRTDFLISHGRYTPLGQALGEISWSESVPKLR